MGLRISDNYQIMKCTLCSSDEISVFASVKDKNYYKCKHCDLVFLDPLYYLNVKEEKIRYDLHQNNIEDKGYVDFLNRVIKPTLEFISQGDVGLDYGCGPNPVLANLVEQEAYSCDYYDPIFFPEIKQKQYDFIFATECFEHFYSPEKEMQTIDSLLKPNGLLAIMTEINSHSDDFADWYYIKDPTHVCFYSESTIEYICITYGFKLVYSDKHRVAVLKRL